MKLILILMIFLFACNRSENSSDKSISKKETEKVIKQTDTGKAEIAVEKIDKKEITFQVYYTFSYCGGAPPSEEILAEANKQRWFQESEILLRAKGKSESDISLMTDAEGKVTAEIPYGNYSVLVGKKASDQMSHLFNPECKQITDRIWMNFTLAETGVNGKDIDLLNVLFNFPCDPCDPSIKMRP